MTEPASLPALIWDMGGILYRYFTEVLLDYAPARGWCVRDVALGPTGAQPDEDYEAMSRGEIDEQAYVVAVRRRLRAIGVDVDPVAAIDWTAEFRASAWHVIEAAHRAGHPQALLTNDATVWLGERWWETWPPASWFDVVVDVATLGVRKPAAEPYLRAAAALGVQPDQCVFVDDLVVNCRGAEAVGMQSHHVDIARVDDALYSLADRLGLRLSTQDAELPKGRGRRERRTA